MYNSNNLAEKYVVINIYIFLLRIGILLFHKNTYRPKFLVLN